MNASIDCQRANKIANVTFCGLATANISGFREWWLSFRVYENKIHVTGNARRWIWLSPCVLFFGFGKPWRIRFGCGQKLNAMWMLYREKTVRITQSIQYPCSSSIDYDIRIIRFMWMMHGKNPNWKWRTRSQSGQTNHKQFSYANQRPTTSISNLFSGVVVYWAFTTLCSFDMRCCWVTSTLRVPYGMKCI